jgi:hypothetical protein
MGWKSGRRFQLARHIEFQNLAGAAPEVVEASNIAANHCIADLAASLIAS